MRKTFGQSIAGALAIVALACMAFVTSDAATADEHTARDLSAVTCKDVLLASGEDRDGIILVLHAYLLGEAKQFTYDVDVLAEATDGFFETCIAKPESQALKTMRDQLKSE